MKYKNKNKLTITVSREAGSGGKLIAQKVAKRLSLQFYDQKLIDLIAKSANKRKEILQKLDEKERSLLDDMVKSLLDPEYLSENTFILKLATTIAALGKKGNAVILGRGANFILPAECTLRIRIIAPYLTRVYYTQKYEKRTKADAEKRVKRFDKDRKEFVRQYFGKNPSSSNYYDLVFNTKILQLDDIVDTIVLAARQRMMQA